MEARLESERYRFWVKTLAEHAGSLLKYARRLTNGDETKAEDLVQQVRARILQYLPEPDPIRSIRSYLFRTLYNCWTRTKPKAAETNLDKAVDEVVQFPTATVELKIVMERVLEQMVPVADVQTVVAMRIAGCTFAEIGENLGRNSSYARLLWHRFLNELRKSY